MKILEPVEAYMRDLNAVPRKRLTPGQERRAGRRRLSAANLPLVFPLVRRYRFSGLPVEDLIAAGNLGLARAAARFNPRRGRFSTVATWWIRKEIQRAIADAGRQAASIFDPETGRLAIDPPDRPHPGLPPEGLREAILKALASLPGRERWIIERRFLVPGRRPPTFEEMGRDLHLSGDYVSDLVQQTLLQLRSHPAVREWIQWDEGKETA